MIPYPRPPLMGWVILLSGFLLACWALGLAYNAGRHSLLSEVRACTARADSLSKRIGLPIYKPDGSVAWIAPPIDSAKSHDTVKTRRLP